ncbi:MAG: CDP-glucose 4,6-dehydratase [Eubacterium sp.]|nr:CDP-glucose 4,6-dehydratase [Eubacterium sp.]
MLALKLGYNLRLKSMLCLFERTFGDNNLIKNVSDFYKSKKILITGNTGFKGTWMNLMLEHMEASVWGFALPLGNSFVSDAFFQKVDPAVYGNFFGNISNMDLVSNCIQNFKPEIIFHLASHSSLNHSLEKPHYILETNIMGVLNLLESVRAMPSVKAVVIVTSDKVYQDFDLDACYREESPLGGTDPYATSKVCQELLTQCYHHSFFQNWPNIATARASNVIGPGDSNQTRLFPYLSEEFSAGRTPSIRNPQAIRPWQSVMDVIMGYLILGKYLFELDEKNDREPVRSFNFGPSEEGFVSVEQFANMVSSEFANKKYRVIDAPDRIRQEARILKLDSTKAFHELGWKPIESLRECIHNSTEFVKEEKKGVNIKTLARKFVQDYLNR